MSENRNGSRNRERICSTGSGGTVLLELMIVTFLLAATVSIALPSFLHSLRRAESEQCATIRHTIENAEIHYVGDHNQPSNSIPDLVKAGYLSKEYLCPEKGEFVWITTDPDDPRFPKLGCSIHFWQAPAPAPDDPLLLFSDDFDSLDNLTPLKGKWGIEDGDLVTKKKGEHRILFGDANWTDLEIQVTATLEKGKGYGIFYRVSGGKKLSGYLFQYDPGKNPDSFLVRKVVDGKYKKPLKKAAMPSRFPVYNQSHEISIRAVGSHHIVRVDGEQVLEFDDDEFTEGKAGFRKWDNSDVSFTSAVVLEAEEP